MGNSVLYNSLLDLAKGKEKSRAKIAGYLTKTTKEERTEVILKGVSSKNPKIRRTAYALIGEMRDLDFAPVTVNGLNDKNVDVLQMVVWAIGRMKWKDSLPDLIRLLKKGHGFKVTKTIVWAWGEIGDPSVVPILSEMLEGASARLSEGILVCGMKLGYDAFVKLVASLNCDLPTVQSALRDASFASGEIRGAFLRAILKTKDSGVLHSLLEALPYVTLQEAEYKRLLEDQREIVRMSVYLSITHATLTRSVKQSYLVQALSDESNRVVTVGLENLLSYMDEANEVKQRVESVIKSHPSPKVRALAECIMEQHERYKELEKTAPKWGRYVLETLPGLERFIEMESDLLGISFRKRRVGRGRMEIELDEQDSDLEDLKSLHTIGRICSVVSISHQEKLVALNPYVDQADASKKNFILEQVTIQGYTFEMVTTVTERQMIRPSRTLRHTSLDWRVARAMILCSEPKTGDIFVDPTCGSGTLLMDRATMGAYSSLVGGDRDPDAIQVARSNLKDFKSVHLYQWDATSMSLADDSVTVIVANLPFGRRVGNHEENVALYPKLLEELTRVLRVDGRAVLLTQEVTLLLEVLKPLKNKLDCELDLSIEMGGLTPHIIYLRRK